MPSHFDASERPRPPRRMNSYDLGRLSDDILGRLRSGDLLASPPGSTAHQTPVGDDDIGLPATEPDPPPPRPRPASGGHRSGGVRAALRDRLPVAFRGAIVDPALRGALTLAGVALVAALAAVLLAWRGAPRPVALPAPTPAVGIPVNPGSPVPTGAPAGTPVSTSAT